MKICSFDDCGRPVKARGWCVQHDRQHKQGQEMKPITSRHPTSEKCTWGDGECDRKANQRGFCQAHLSEYHGIKCRLDYCDKFVHAKELCSAHFSQQNLGQELRPINSGTTICNYLDCKEMAWHYRSKRCKEHLDNCGMEGCENSTKFGSVGQYTQLCSMHLQRRRNGTDMEHTKRRQDGRYINSNGYVLVSAKDPRTRNGWVMEHRLVMEKSLGRLLTKQETVHHKNGNREDNRMENLELWSKSQPYGQRVEDKIVWAKEIIATYGDYTP